MERKKVQLGIIALALLLAFAAAWLLFSQDAEFNASRQKGQEKERTSPEQEATAREGSSGPNASENASTGGSFAGRSENASKNRTQKRSQANGTPQERRVVTPAFVLDLADFVVSSYHPEWGMDNPREKGTLRISVRAINARYGTELTGLRHSSSALQKARQEVLDHLLKPRILESAYDRYSASFVRALIRQARESTRRVEGPEGEVREKELSDGDISEMLRLGSSYLQNVSTVFITLGQNRELDPLIADYLEADNKAVHFNYKLSQIEEKLGEGGEDAQEEKAGELQEEREEIVRRYSQAIAAREDARQMLVQRLGERAGREIELDVAEILYIAEWVHRRLQGDAGSRSSIVKGGELLRDLGDTLERRALSLDGD
ncbi:MAG: hypothetical protein V5B78_04570 [Desulfohalobiaceae bacterium]